jgi:enediyne biosynthesis protein E4
MADINYNINLYLVIAGNMYGSEPEITSNDAGKGLYLKGDGSGNFTPVQSYNDGLIINGEVRELSLINIGKEKNPAIIAAKNNGFIQLIKIGNLR